MSKAGKILVLVTGTFSASCSAGGACNYEVGAKLDGTAPVVGASTVVSSTASATVGKPVALAGMIDAAPGTHQITLFHDTSGANLSSGTLSTDTRVVAFAIG